MKNLTVKEILDIRKDSRIPNIELLERERESNRIYEKIRFGKEEKFPVHEMTWRERNEGRIVRIGGRPFLVIAALINDPHDYVEHEIPKLADQLDKLALNLPGTLATKYKFTAGDITEVVNDASNMRFYATKHIDGASYSKRWTIKGDELLFGTGTSITDWVTGIDVTGSPVTVLPGLVIRYREKAQRIKVQKSIYTLGEGELLGIEKGHSTIDPSLAKPYLRWDLVAGGHPELKYVKSIYDGLELQKNWSDGKGMVAFDKPTKPSLTDMSALPAVGASALWGYQAIYL